MCDSRPAPDSATVAAPLTAIPASATATIAHAETCCGEISRAMAEYAIATASTSSVIPLTCAARTSTRWKPYVIAPRAGRAARRSATSASPSAAASVSMCAASAISASECASTPTVTSTAMNATISPSASATRRREAGGPCSGPWACPVWLTPPRARGGGRRAAPRARPGSRRSGAPPRCSAVCGGPSSSCASRSRS